MIHMHTAASEKKSHTDTITKENPMHSFAKIAVTLALTASLTQASRMALLETWANMNDN